jgi:hypothetical protein
MLFAEFDWTRILIAAGVGAAIGAIVYVVRKLAGGSTAGDASA